MNCFDMYVIQFLKDNNLLCRTHFNEEVFEKIEDEEDKRFYEQNSCYPVFYYRPNALIGEIGIYCRPYCIHGCKACGNPYAKANRTLRERFEKMNGLTITHENLCELFWKSEDGKV